MKSVLVRLLFLNLFFYSLALQATVQKDCNSAFYTDFDIQKIDQNQIVRISKLTFVVTDSLGEKYLLRLEGNKSDLLFERFAVNFINSSLMIRAREVKVLDLAESEMVFNLLKTKFHKELKPMFQPFSRVVPRVSVAKFYSNAVLGSEYLSSKDAFSDLRDFLVFIALIRSDEELDSFNKDQLKFYWNKLDERSKNLFFEDFKEIILDSKITNAQESFEYLISNYSLIYQSKLKKIALKRYKNIPQNIRTQLADAWVLCLVLGVFDLHASNWVLLEDKVLLIDLAYYQDTLVNLNHTPLYVQQHPYGFRQGIGRDYIQFIFSDVSQELKKFLLSLDEKKIQEIAEKSSYKLGSQKTNQILIRLERVNHKLM